MKDHVTHLLMAGNASLETENNNFDIAIEMYIRTPFRQSMIIL